MKSKVGDFDEEVREVFLRRLRKELTGVVQGISEKRRLLVCFQDRCEKYLTSNQRTVVVVDNIPMDKETEVPTVSVICDGEFD